MILAHLSELHLGFRAYERTERGRNVRERDVAGAFERAIEELRRLGPDLVVVVGDVFDRADPPPSALLSLTRGIDALRAALPSVPVALVAGARDTPLRPGDEAALSVLESLPGVEIATRGTRSVALEHLDTRLWLLPWAAGLEEPRPVPAPDGAARYNVLVAYGAVARRGPGVRVDPAAWSYLAMGGEHAHRRVAANAAYAGALERVGGSPWDEAAEEKGLVTADLESGVIRFHALPVRPVVALAAVRTPPSGPAGLPDRVREVTREIPGGIEDKIVRLRVRGALQRDLLVLQGPLLADLSDRTLHLDVEVEETEAAAPLPLAAEVLRRRLEERPAVSAGVDALLGPEREEEPAAALRTRLAGDDPVLGRLDLDLPRGLTAVVSPEPSAGHRLLHLLAGGGDRSVPPWLDPRTGGPDELLASLEGVLARLRGAARVEEALSRLEGRATGRVSERIEELERRMVVLEGAEEELRRLERDLREIRADHAEVAGDLEVATMEWLRERQDAETNLQAYRDRARELKARLGRIEGSGADSPCPTCGRLLREHYDDVLGDLRDEWEAVVQDGSWWRRRREQLDLKPETLQELEGRSLRLQAAVEECAERVEVARSRVRERDEVRQRLAELRGGPGVLEGRAGERVGEEAVRELLREVVGEVRGAVRERLLETASRYVARITGSRILALDEGDGGVRLEGPRGLLVPSDDELAAAEACLRLAGAVVAGDGGAVEGAIIPAPLVERLREGDRFRLLDLLPSLRDRLRHVLVGMRADTAERRHDALDAVLEVRSALGGGAAGSGVRWLAAGTVRIVLPAPHSPA